MAVAVIVFEMLTGQRLFAGETVSETMADVMKSDIDFDALPQDTPAWLRSLLERCLERDPLRRLRDIGEARVFLEAGAADFAGQIPLILKVNNHDVLQDEADPMGGQTATVEDALREGERRHDREEERGEESAHHQVAELAAEAHQRQRADLQPALNQRPREAAESSRSHLGPHEGL